MTRDILNNFNFVQHNDLWDKCQSFKPQTKAPHEFPCHPATVHNACKDKSCWKKVQKVLEFIADWIIRLLTKAIMS